MLFGISRRDFELRRRHRLGADVVEAGLVLRLAVNEMPAQHRNAAERLEVLDLLLRHLSSATARPCWPSCPFTSTYIFLADGPSARPSTFEALAGTTHSSSVEHAALAHFDISTAVAIDLVIA